MAESNDRHDSGGVPAPAETPVPASIAGLRWLDEEDSPAPQAGPAAGSLDAPPPPPASPDTEPEPETVAPQALPVAPTGGHAIHRPDRGGWRGGKRRTQVILVLVAALLIVVPFALIESGPSGRSRSSASGATPARPPVTEGATFSYLARPIPSGTITATVAPPPVTSAPLTPPAPPPAAAPAVAKAPPHPTVPRGTQPATAPKAPPHPVGTTNLALNRPVSDGGHTQDYVAGNAVDGSPDSYWESTDNAFPQSIEVNLGSDVRIGRLVLGVPPLSDWLARTQTITVYGNTGSGSDFVIAGARGYDFEPGNGNALSVSLPATTTRYVKLVFSSNNDWPAGQLSTFQVFGA